MLVLTSVFVCCEKVLGKKQKGRVTHIQRIIAQRGLGFFGVRGYWKRKGVGG